MSTDSAERNCTSRYCRGQGGGAFETGVSTDDADHFDRESGRMDTTIALVLAAAIALSPPANDQTQVRQCGWFNNGKSGHVLCRWRTVERPPARHPSQTEEGAAPAGVNSVGAVLYAC